MFSKFNKLKKHHQLMTSFIIAIALIGVWRGVWGLLDYYILPNNFVLSSLVTLIVGVIILVITHHKLA